MWMIIAVWCADLLAAPLNKSHDQHDTSLPQMAAACLKAIVDARLTVSSSHAARPPAFAAAVLSRVTALPSMYAIAASLTRHLASSMSPSANNQEGCKTESFLTLILELAQTNSGWQRVIQATATKVISTYCNWWASSCCALQCQSVAAIASQQQAFISVLACQSL